MNNDTTNTTIPTEAGDIPTTPLATSPVAPLAAVEAVAPLINTNPDVSEPMIKDEFRPKHLSVDDIKNGCVTVYGNNSENSKICMIQEEFRQGIETIQSYDKSVTFYGSARLPETDQAYQKARDLAYRISKELHYAVLSGGGPGIMEAANRGAYEAGGKSVGLTIVLPHEQNTNKYVTDVIPFYFFFARQVSMRYTTDACLFFPGGFGTLAELFEMIVLRQTKKVGEVPLVLVGVEFWTPLQQVIDDVLIHKYNTVAEDEKKLYIITDDNNLIIDTIKKAKLHNGMDAFQ